MGFFSRLFGYNDLKVVKQEEEDRELQPEIKKEDFVDDSDYKEENSSIYIINYGTGMPIDAIYAYIEKDYEQEGYDDAICYSDNSYKEHKKTIIRSGLNRRFEQVKLRYMNDLREIDVRISSVEQQGMLNTSSVLRARKETYSEHLITISEMEQRLEKNDEQLLSMLNSYERGFQRGLSAMTQIYLNKNNEK